MPSQRFGLNRHVFKQTAPIITGETPSSTDLSQELIAQADAANTIALQIVDNLAVQQYALDIATQLTGIAAEVAALL
jgi:hypothetical protein